MDSKDYTSRIKVKAYIKAFLIALIISLSTFSITVISLYYTNGNMFFSIITTLLSLIALFNVYISIIPKVFKEYLHLLKLEEGEEDYNEERKK